jgi:hypothetical protein
LPAVLGPCQLRLRWGTRIQPAAPSELPFAPPRFDEIAGFPAIWTLHLPRRFHASALEKQSGRNAAAWHALLRAEGQFQLLRVLADRLQGGESLSLEEQFLAVQTRFYCCLRDADQHLRAAFRQADSSALGRLEVLRRDNQLALQNTKWERLRRQGEEAAQYLAGGGPRQLDGTEGMRPDATAVPPPGPVGVPYYFALARDLTELRVPCATREQLTTQRAFLASFLLGVLAIAMFGMVRLPQASRLSQLGWPEGVILAGWLWWLFLPAAGLGLLVAAPGVVKRLSQLVRWLVRGWASVFWQPASGPQDTPAAGRAEELVPPAPS